MHLIICSSFSSYCLVCDYRVLELCVVMSYISDKIKEHKAIFSHL